MVVVTLKFHDKNDASFSNFPEKRLTAVGEYKRKEHGKHISFTYSSGYGETVNPPNKKFVHQLYKDYDEGSYTPFSKLLVNNKLNDEWIEIHLFSINEGKVELLERKTVRALGVSEVISYEEFKENIQEKYGVEVKGPGDLW